MAISSLRNLIIGYIIAVFIVLLMIWITFSSLRSQEKELASIRKAREALQKLGPLQVDLKDFESTLNNSLVFDKEGRGTAYQEGVKKLQSDSIVLMQLASSHPENREEYQRLAGLLHQMTAFADHILYSHRQKSFDTINSTWNKNSGTEITTAFKTTVEKLEAESRQVLSSSYDNTIGLTRKMVTYVSIIAAILISILIISFFLIYRDIRNRERKQEQLRTFNEELEKQVAEKTAEIRASAEQVLKEKNLSDSIIDSLPGVFYLRSLITGDLLRWNKNFQSTLGVTREELIKSKLFDYVADEDKKAVKEEVEKATLKGFGAVEANMKTKNGKVPFYITGISINYENQPCIMGMGIDITERKKAERDLITSEANLKTIFDTTDDGYALLDENFGVISYNQRGLDFVVNELGGNPADSNNLIDFLPPERRSFLLSLKEKVFETGHVNYEISYRQPDNSYKWYYIRMFPVTNNEKKVLGLMMAVTDITEKKLLEQEILDSKVQEQKTVTRAILNAEERERNKIGQELHDNVNQILASIKLYLSMAKEKDEKSMVERINESTLLLDNAIDEIRSLSKSQVTPLKGIDLRELIQSLVDKLRESTDITTKLVYTVNNKHLEDDLKLNIYRIVQEQINNILKHAKASVVSIVLDADATDLHLSVSDNGKGFDPGQNRKGIGISNMINRVESFNGKLDIISSPGKGCEIQIRIPC